jgi:hypothetical protein
VAKSAAGYQSRTSAPPRIRPVLAVSHPGFRYLGASGLWPLNQQQLLLYRASLGSVSDWDAVAIWSNRHVSCEGLCSTLNLALVMTILGGSSQIQSVCSNQYIASRVDEHWELYILH